MPERRQESETKREKAAAQRRAKILDAAVMCFLENGYHQTGVRDIARRAGISLGNLYNHFPGKHDVLVEIAALERAELDPFLALLAKRAAAPAVLEEFITAYATYLAAPETDLLAIEITSEAIRKSDIGALFLANRDLLVGALAAVLERGIADGNFRRPADPHETSQMIIELIDAAAYRSALSGVAMREILRGLEGFVLAAVLSPDVV